MDEVRITEFGKGSMKVMQIYKVINDKTWLLQVILGNIMILIYSHNEKAMDFLGQFLLNKWIEFILIWVFAIAIMRLAVLFISFLICLSHKRLKM